jgi:hypothetical protein
LWKFNTSGPVESFVRCGLSLTQTLFKDIHAGTHAIQLGAHAIQLKFGIALVQTNATARARNPTATAAHLAPILPSVYG